MDVKFIGCQMTNDHGRFGYGKGVFVDGIEVGKRSHL
ncbi:hypothetical protein [Bacillus sp. SD075]